MQIAFFRFATSSGFLAGAETRYKKYSCKGPCKGKSYETICENIVSQYQTLVSSLPREAVFVHRRQKTEFITGPHRQPSNNVLFENNNFTNTDSQLPIDPNQPASLIALRL